VYRKLTHLLARLLLEQLALALGQGELFCNILAERRRQS